MDQHITVSNTPTQIVGAVNLPTQMVGASNSYSISYEHNSLTGRDASDAHPMSAISGLSSALSDISSTVNSTSSSIVTSGTFENGQFQFLNSSGQVCFSIQMPIYDGGVA